MKPRASEQSSGTFSVEDKRTYYFLAIQAIGLLIVGLTLTGIFTYRGGFSYRSNPKLEFNWHYFLSVLGFTYFFANALTIYRLMPILSKTKLKLIHFGGSGAVIICACLGLFFVIDEGVILGYKHFQSLHSWIGIFTIALLVIQFIFGIVFFLSSKIQDSLLKVMMSWHIKIGILTFILGGAALITGLKIGNYSDGEMILNNFNGGLIIIYCILTCNILNDQNLR